jgi:hypothetical protein
MLRLKIGSLSGHSQSGETLGCGEIIPGGRF